MQRHISLFKYLLILFIFNIYAMAVVNAQQLSPDNFTALRSNGPMPEDFLNSARKASTDYSTKKSKTRSGRKAKGKEKFEIEQDYGMNEMLLSGRVVYGDVIGEYVNRVADSLLIPYPELRKQVRFYVTKSDVANAYSTDQGVIFINAGLIARLKNEAQLAFVLAHEIVHYVKQHNIHIFLEKEKIFSKKRKKNSYKFLTVTERLLAVNFRSKEIETEADLVALRTYFSVSPYDIGSVEDVFNALLYSSYPFTNELFDLSLLESGDMIIPNQYLVDEVENIRVNEDEADSLSTHPSVKIRKQKIRDLADSLPEAGSMRFLQPEETFKFINTLARFEVIRELIMDHRLIESLFCASAMLEEFPHNKFVKKCFAASLYGLSAYKTHGEADESYYNYRDIKGEMRQVSFLINKLSRRDLNIIALNYAWRRHSEYPDDKYLAAITSELFNDLVFENGVKDGFFHTRTLTELKADLKKPVAEDTTAADNRRRKKKHTRETKIDSTFTKFAFVDLMKNEQFINDMNYYYDKRDSADKVEEARNSSYTNFPVPEKRHTKKKKDRKYITRVLMADPYIIKQDNRKLDNVLYVESELNQARLKEMMSKNAVIAKLDIDMIDSKGMDQDSTVAFNEMAFVNEYLEERFHQNGDGIVISPCKENIDPLMQRGQSHYLGWSAIVSIQKKKPVVVLALLSILPYMWPYTIYEFVVPKIHTYYYSILFDVNTGKLKIGNVYKVRSGLRTDQMNSHIYDFMYSIKKSYE